MKRFVLVLMILSVLLCASALAETVYKQGDKGAEVLAIKERMLELGYYTGNISHNVFNDTMTERVKQLQKANGLKQTGTVDEELYALIFSDSVIMKNGKPYKEPETVAAPTEAPQAGQPAQTQETPAVTAPANKVLYREGDSGSDVLAIKQRMLELGYYNGNISNNAYNSTMTERVKQLQAINGREATGVIDQETYDLIYSNSVMGLNGLAAGTIKQGDSGSRVRAIRNRMYELKYFDAAGGSEFTAAMTERVKLLQKMNGFAETGVITPELYDYIMSDKCTQCGVHVNPMYNAMMRTLYKLDGEKLYHVSSSGNVVIFIVDYFANNWLSSVVQNYPRMLDNFHDFTYYSNCDPRYIGTYPSITHMLTGHDFDPSLLVGEFFEQSWTSDSANYIYDTIHSLGYEFRYYYYTSISDGAMSWAVGKLDNLVDMTANPEHEVTPIYSFTDFYDNLKAQGLTVDQTDKKYIQMIHLRGAHAPYSADANGNYNTSVGRNENIAGYMRMVDDYIQRMKELGLYDDATIIITADHGDKGSNMQVVYWIKQANERHDSIITTDAPISHDDFPGTILSIIGADYPYGDSIFDWQAGETRRRTCSVVDRDTTRFPLVSSYSDLELGAHNMWKTYTYTGNGQELMRQQKRGSYTYEFLAQSFN